MAQIMSRYTHLLVSNGEVPGVALVEQCCRSPSTMTQAVFHLKEFNSNSVLLRMDLLVNGCISRVRSQGGSSWSQPRLVKRFLPIQKVPAVPRQAVCQCPPPGRSHKRKVMISSSDVQSVAGAEVDEHDFPRFCVYVSTSAVHHVGTCREREKERKRERVDE